MFGPAGNTLIETYKKYSQSTEEAISTLLSDAIFRIPAVRLADLNIARHPTYVYLFNYRSITKGPSGLEFGAMHGLELAPVFHVDSAMGYIYVGPRGTWSTLSDQMVAAWTSFARTGDPNNPMLPMWPRYDVTHRATLAFGTHTDVMLDPYGPERRAWDGISTSALQNVDVITLSDLLQ